MAAEGSEQHPERIDPVSVQTLRETARAGSPDPGVEALAAAELDYLRRRRFGATRGDLAGLALSGGGIRSASFALGVMQKLAEHGVLQRMDYLSTVSGGGYIGSALTWFLGSRNATDPAAGQPRFGLAKDDFPWGTDAGGDSTSLQATMLDWLRQHGNYLTPGREGPPASDGDRPRAGGGGGNITLTSLGAVVLRGIVLNLFVWVPLVALLFLAAVVLGAGIEAGLDGLGLIPAWVAGAVASLGVDGAGKGLLVGGVALAVVVLAAFTLTALGYSVWTFFRSASGGLRYGFRRWVETVSRYPLWTAVGALVLASVPLVEKLSADWIANSGGPLAALAGAVAGLWGYARSVGTESRPMGGLGATVAAGLMIYGVGLVCFQLAAHLHDHWGILGRSLFAFWVAAAVATGVLVNINYISIHRFYRDRLMETFLPDLDAALAGRTGAAREANRRALQDVLAEERPQAPYPILNANLVLVASPDRRRRLRGGDSFVMTPRYCGSSATGWLDTRQFFGGDLTLATAMAISGAAANPHTGGGGVGLTRSRSVSLLMALLNLRLGYWGPSPRRDARPLPPNHFLPGLMQAFGLHREDSAFIEISDGGHFDNLALYELIRRRLRLIILCDGAADPCFGFADLNTLRRRIAADFEARIEFEGLGEGAPQDLIPDRLKGLGSSSAGYATAADMADRGYIVGRIRYAPRRATAAHDDGEPLPEQGVLVYLKTTMVHGLPFGIKAYKGAHPEFPDETTADQFFDEEQFDAYRELGSCLAEKLLRDTPLAAELERIAQTGEWKAPGA